MRLLTILLAAAFVGSTFAAEPNTDPVLVVIDAAIQSLRTETPIIVLQPACSATGLAVTNNGQGTGLSVTAVGGGPGSQTTGMTVSVTGGECVVNQMAVEAVSKVVDPQVVRAIQLLNEIKLVVQARLVDKDALAQKVTALRQLRYTAAHN